MPNSAPIGIFDSGIGGLTLAHAITELIPQEPIIYFGDTAHLPYGDKSATAIQAYSVKICNLLLEKNCKLILIACNSASAAAYDLVKTYVGTKAVVVNVIDPVIQYLDQQWAGKTLGLIGTKQTVNSGIYARKAEALGKDIHIQSLATPLLAPMIEEGFFNNTISEQIIREYLEQDVLKNIEGLILACTHYPLIKAQIDQFYQGRIPVIDTSQIVAQEIKRILIQQDLSIQSGVIGSRQFFVSDYTDSFEKSTQLFFGEAIKLTQYPIWD
ncbi:glutamate racemase [Aquirufa ecclesiirivi]|uniref:glutamate racemase n=1 Tax=Aquirufa ecclesiirivi TaxID=2715124 RepID=UPI0023D868FB|nr:glutamate racemase [Aquirufa ecclesiirivi]MDF0693584.1 glutamate racemase [Aquirufa ecclesiirivi]